MSKNNNKINHDDEHDDKEQNATQSGKNIFSMFQPQEEEQSSRIIGLYGDVSQEKSELIVYGLFTLHRNRVKLTPRPFTAAEKRKIVAAEKKGVEPDVEIKFDEVSQPIDFVISTPGGRAVDMFSIYDTMRMVRKDCDISTFGLGQVMSAGTLLLAAGTKGKRKIGKHTRVMIHQVSAGTAGPHHEMINEIAEIEHTQKQYIKCLASETKMTETMIKKLFERKVNIYLSAEEAVKHGFADIIV